MLLVHRYSNAACQLNLDKVERSGLGYLQELVQQDHSALGTHSLPVARHVRFQEFQLCHETSGNNSLQRENHQLRSIAHQQHDVDKPNQSAEQLVCQRLN